MLRKSSLLPGQVNIGALHQRPAARDQIRIQRLELMMPLKVVGQERLACWLAKSV